MLALLRVAVLIRGIGSDLVLRLVSAAFGKVLMLVFTPAQYLF
ncbi:MAG: hypothetical protein AAGL17_16420 [Cyanobacteria bacterium J06576_12]